MDWSGCELVEVVEGKVSGVPLVVGTRIPAEAIVKNFEAGLSIEEVQRNYPGATLETVQALIEFAGSQRLAPAR